MRMIEVKRRLEGEKRKVIEEKTKRERKRGLICYNMI